MDFVSEPDIDVYRDALPVVASLYDSVPMIAIAIVLIVLGAAAWLASQVLRTRARSASRWLVAVTAILLVTASGALLGRILATQQIDDAAERAWAMAWADQIEDTYGLELVEEEIAVGQAALRRGGLEMPDEVPSTDEPVLYRPWNISRIDSVPDGISYTSMVLRMAWTGSDFVLLAGDLADEMAPYEPAD